MIAPDAFAQNWNDRLHFGDSGGVPLKLLYLRASLVGVGLVVTGFVMWWLKRRAQALGRERRAGRAPRAATVSRGPRIPA